MNKIRKISKKYNLHIIEDAAQSILSILLSVENILEIKILHVFGMPSN